MNQTLAPKRHYSQCIEFDKTAFIKKNKFNSRIVDTILNTVEEAITNAPNEYSDSEDKTIDMFSDLLYDTSGFLRLKKFTQYGAFYIVEVYDHVTDHFFYLAYSIYDIIDGFNSESDEKIKYIKLAETSTDMEVIVKCVKEPKRYSEDRSAINEYNKYIVTIGTTCFVLYASHRIITVSQVYQNVEYTDISEKIVGEVTFKIGEYKINKVFNYNTNSVDGTEYKDMFDEISEETINTYAPYGIEKWQCESITGNETDSLEGIAIRNGPITFEAVLVEPPVDEESEEQETTT